eukprot:m.128414 g.128414  ORF g.128414 m.128414 type:complete len:360 (-) comp17429_c0_seq9:1090-2169(-)
MRSLCHSPRSAPVHRSIARATTPAAIPISLQWAVIVLLLLPVFNSSTTTSPPLRGPAHTCSGADTLMDAGGDGGFTGAGEGTADRHMGVFSGVARGWAPGGTPPPKLVYAAENCFRLLRYQSWSVSDENRHRDVAQSDGVGSSDVSVRHGSMCSLVPLNARQDVAFSGSRTCELVMSARPKSQCCNVLLCDRTLPMHGATSTKWLVADRVKHTCLLMSVRPLPFAVSCHCCGSVTFSPNVHRAIQGSIVSDTAGVPGVAGTTAATTSVFRWRALRVDCACEDIWSTDIATRNVPWTPRASWLTAMSRVFFRIFRLSPLSARASAPMISGLFMTHHSAKCDRCSATVSAPLPISSMSASL